MKDTYNTIATNSEGFFKEKGSKFFAYAYHVISEDEIKDILNQLKKQHHSARHHCYAWRLGKESIRFRANDDGEPSSTAGKPILGQLLSFDLTNCLIVVVRYFGGTLLGVSGLINAYKNAAMDAITNAQIVIKRIENEFEINFTYNELNEVMQIIKHNKVNIISTRFEEKCNLIFSIRKSESDRIKELFENFYGVAIHQLN